MLRILINTIWTAANTLVNRTETPTPDQPSTSKWRVFRNLIFSAISTLGIPLIRSISGSDTLYDCVNTFLASSTTNRNPPDHHQQRHSNISRFSRPNFRRRSHHNRSLVRILKPTINIHIH